METQTGKEKSKRPKLHSNTICSAFYVSWKWKTENHCDSNNAVPRVPGTCMVCVRGIYMYICLCHHHISFLENTIPSPKWAFRNLSFSSTTLNNSENAQPFEPFKDPLRSTYLVSVPRVPMQNNKQSLTHKQNSTYSNQWSKSS